MYHGVLCLSTPRYCRDNERLKDYQKLVCFALSQKWVRYQIFCRCYLNVSMKTTTQSKMETNAKSETRFEKETRHEQRHQTHSSNNRKILLSMLSKQTRRPTIHTRREIAQHWVTDHTSETRDSIATDPIRRVICWFSFKIWTSNDFLRYSN